MGAFLFLIYFITLEEDFKNYDSLSQKHIIFLFFIIGFQLSAQTSITGYLDVKHVDSDTEIHLSKIALEDIPNYYKAKKIAVAKIDKNGFFEFKRNQISDKEVIYRLYVNRFEKALKDTLQVDHLFLFSESDTISFKKSKIPFVDYITTNKADKEWQKLKKFEAKTSETTFKLEDSISKDYVASMKTYAKDSLKILRVKLISIKQLDNKNLLEKDIAKNIDYYVALLKELKASDIERFEYLFLENKLAFLTTEVAENKYTIVYPFSVH